MALNGQALACHQRLFTNVVMPLLHFRRRFRYARASFSCRMPQGFVAVQIGGVVSISSWLAVWGLGLCVCSVLLAGAYVAVRRKCAEVQRREAALGLLENTAWAEEPQGNPEQAGDATSANLGATRRYLYGGMHAPSTGDCTLTPCCDCGTAL